MTIKIKISDLRKMPQEDLAALANQALKLKEGQKSKTIESYFKTAHEKQIEFHKAASKFRIRYFLGGNRSGKSTAGFMEDILFSLGRHPYMKGIKTPNKGVIVLQDFENHAKNILEPKFQEWMPEGSIEKMERNQSGAPRKIILRNGSTIDILSHDQDPKVFEGADYDWAHFDEPPPKFIYTAVWRGLVDRGGRMHLTATPLASPWLYNEFLKAKQGDGLRWFINVPTKVNAKNLGEGNEELGLKRIDEFTSLLDDEEKAARTEGEFVQMKGQIFKDWDRSHHLIPSFTWPKDWVIYESIDPHPHKPWALSWTGVTANKKKILLKSKLIEGVLEDIADEIIQCRGELDIQGGYKPKIIMTLIDNSSSVPLWSRSNTDPTARRRSVKDELETYIGPNGGGPRITVAPKNVKQKIDLFKSWLKVSIKGDRKESEFYAFDSSENEKFIQEIENYVWDSKRNGLNAGLKDKPKKENDDILDSIMQVALTLPRQHQDNGEDQEDILSPVKLWKGSTWKI